jgi:hypothetical protein
MLSRSGRDDGKLICRLDIPLSEDLHDLIVVKASANGRPKAEFARDTLIAALKEPLLMGLPDEVRSQLVSLAQMAGTAPNDLAATLLSGLVRDKFSMAQSLLRERLLGQWEDDPKDGRSTIGDRS